MTHHTTEDLKDQLQRHGRTLTSAGLASGVRRRRRAGSVVLAGAVTIPVSVGLGNRPITLPQVARHPSATETGLKLSWVATRSELNDAEAENIVNGVLKWRSRRRSVQSRLDGKAARDLHRDLFGDVWAWAGSYRGYELNIGVEFWQVSTAVRHLTEDAKYWFAAGGVMKDLSMVRAP